MNKSDDNDRSAGSAPQSNDNTLRRRRLIKGTIAAGVTVAVAEKWVSPYVRSVSLPAHAQTSEYTTSSREDGTFIVDSRADDDQEIG